MCVVLLRDVSCAWSLCSMDTTNFIGQSHAEQAVPEARTEFIGQHSVPQAVQVRTYACVCISHTPVCISHTHVCISHTPVCII